MQVLGGIAAVFFIVGGICLFLFNTLGHLAWIIPVVAVGGIIFYLTQADKGIYK